MISFLRRLLCSHEYVWVRNVYGDEINAAGGRRSWWRCRKCGKWLLSNALIDERGHTDHDRIRPSDLWGVAMTHEEIKAAIERLGRHSKEDNSADAVICRFMDSSGWLVPDFRYALISLLQQADPATHVELPKDYNGETVGIGDKVEHLYNGRWSAPFEIAELRLRPSGWMARSEDGGAVITETCRRYQPTVEDVLREFGDEVQRCCDTEDTIAEYAAKLREVMAYE